MKRSQKLSDSCVVVQFRTELFWLIRLLGITYPHVFFFHLSGAAVTAELKFQPVGTKQRTLESDWGTYCMTRIWYPYQLICSRFCCEAWGGSEHAPPLFRPTGPAEYIHLGGRISLSLHKICKLYARFPFLKLSLILLSHVYVTPMIISKHPAVGRI